jgi:hypothetical protein
MVHLPSLLSWCTYMQWNEETHWELQSEQKGEETDLAYSIH